MHTEGRMLTGGTRRLVSSMRSGRPMCAFMSRSSTSSDGIRLNRLNTRSGFRSSCRREKEIDRVSSQSRSLLSAVRGVPAPCRGEA